ncbi:TIR domain-containing protein [bacterium]|nr:TIR domain-containing protein [bacterium]
MRVFIDHAEADAPAAEDLREFLKSWGLMAELETGARGFRPLGRSDVVVALVSSRLLMSVHRMQMERRTLDAWAEGRLVLVKLDHGLLPVGLRDLKMIDASFESARKMTAWREVERAAKQAINDALVRAEPPAPPPQPTVESDPPVDPKGSGATDEMAAEPLRRSAANRGHSLLSFARLAVIGLAGWAAWLWSAGVSGVIPFWGWLALGVAAVVLLGVPAVKGLVAMLNEDRGKGSQASAPRTGSPPESPYARSAGEEPAAETGAAGDAAGSSLFISYAHVDAESVEPVVRLVEASGKSVWIDKGEITAGEGWAGEIVRAIKQAKGVMVMCSPNAFESDHIKREVYLADRYKKPMLPVFIEAAEMPEDFEYFFAGVQWLELFKLPEAERSGAVARAVAGV